MLFSSLNTGSTDLRDTEVQQPNTTETLSLVISSRAFSANSGQFDAGSTTTASSFLPSTPPFLFCSSIRNRTVSFSVVSLIAMVPDSECRTPTLMVSSAAFADVNVARPRTSPALAASQRRRLIGFVMGLVVSWIMCCHLPDADVKTLRTAPRPPALTESQEACHAAQSAYPHEPTGGFPKMGACPVC